MNILKVIAVIAVIVAVAFAAIYIMGMFEQTKPIADAATGLAGSAQEYVTNNIPTVVAAAGSVATIGGAALSKVQSAQKQVSEMKEQATSQVEQLKEEKEALTSQFTQQIDEAKQGYETQIADLKKQLEESEVDVNEVNKIKQQLQGAQDMHTNFVAQLTSGSQQVIDPATNQVYKLITLEKTIVK